MTDFNRSEFIDLFNKMYQPVKNFLYYKTGDIQLAEDITQDAFVKIWEKRKTIKSSTVKTLLYTVANNLCKNRFEHEQVVLNFANNFHSEEHSNSPDYELEMKEFHQKLQTALGRLNEKYRVVFLMNRIDGLTYVQIAQNLNLSVKAVEKRMKNALHELKKHIDHKI
ncbi:RNA polymerase sigma-70 factor [Puteibacter caeruleilacunae]|nr:RNA polymerase sigma-70 factor [Puteibacter caeruleilacunae]